ncbi:hypothetical protein AXK11_04940 [Cephaloticoccus primus]|uniref:Uncharacterized protein n=1 Tax=Cephaloticoccus primus TaxID=1548207 RepID=A0A139SMQ6_9BACT|nr:hypothetical protein [Cephaloticoccus primus]KXU35883.1 hypothetical protein AXK11_04940 [Cephaloticoccus primus]
MTKDSLAALDALLIEEEAVILDLRKTRLARRLAAKRRSLLTHIRDVARSGDLRLMVLTELAILKGDLLRYANSSEMARSLRRAIEELGAVLRHLNLITDPAKYSLIDQGHSLAKKRENGLPLDDARLALGSHLTRLRNMDRARLEEEEKEIIDTRKALVAAALNGYVERQVRVLGASAEVPSAAG